MTEQAQANRLLKKWRKKLRLNAPSWEEIDLKVVPRSEIESCDGICYWITEYRKAEMKIASCSEDPEPLKALEETIVHELLHIVLEGHAEHDENYDPNYERGLNVIANALIAEQPSKNGKKPTKR